MRGIPLRPVAGHDICKNPLGGEGSQREHEKKRPQGDIATASCEEELEIIQADDRFGWNYF